MFAWMVPILQLNLTIIFALQLLDTLCQLNHANLEVEVPMKGNLALLIFPYST